MSNKVLCDELKDSIRNKNMRAADNQALKITNKMLVHSFDANGQGRTQSNL